MVEAAPTGWTLEELADEMRAKRVCVLTGAGCSTESGIPDYRGPETRRRARNPIRMNQFLRDPNTRRRYWARSFVGFPRFASARPNAAHDALAALERRGVVNAVLTQNVDGLHHAAGSREVVELHGTLYRVRCLDCTAMVRRPALQQRLVRDNPDFRARLLDLAPDGDADIPEELVADFRPPACSHCGGVLKPDVVFFGDSVPRERVERAFAHLQAADVLWVVGSSLAVFSGYRFVRQAQKAGTPVGILNLTETRGDGAARWLVRQKAGAFLPALAEQLGA